MPSWYAKAALQGAMSLLPDPQRANRVFQNHVTHRLTLSEEFFADKLQVAQIHLDHWRQVTDRAGSPGTALEIGTGWHPVVPIAFALHGVKDVATIDVQCLHGDEQIVETLQMFGWHIANDPNRFTPEAGRRVADALTGPSVEPAVRLARVGVQSLIADARNLDLASGSVDLVTSNNTFEHIPLDVLSAIASETRRITSPQGACSHLIDLKDHYSGFDQAITDYNFLRFSERRWARYNNSLQYQNRLRYSAYAEVMDAGGWHRVIENLERDIPALMTVPVHADFARYDVDDLAVHTAWVVARPGRR